MQFCLLRKAASASKVATNMVHGALPQGAYSVLPLACTVRGKPRGPGNRMLARRLIGSPSSTDGPACSFFAPRGLGNCMLARRLTGHPPSTDGPACSFLGGDPQGLDTTKVSLRHSRGSLLHCSIGGTQGPKVALRLPWGGPLGSFWGGPLAALKGRP